jgi:hypothetical protein
MVFGYARVSTGGQSVALNAGSFATQERKRSFAKRLAETRATARSFVAPSPL